MTERNHLDGGNYAGEPMDPSPEAAVLRIQEIVPEEHVFAAKLFRCTPSAFVTQGIITLNVIVFGLMVLSGAGFLTPSVPSALKWGANFAPYTMDGQWWRLLTCVFIHFGIVHIAINMWALYNVGRLVERLYGNGLYALLYIVSGIIASMTSLWWNPEVVSAGASGAILGVYGALLAFLLAQRGSIPKSILLSIRNSTVGLMAYILLSGLAHVGIDNAAHIGGLCSGFILGLVLARPLDVEARQRIALWRMAGCVAAGAVILSALHSFLPTYVVQFRKTADWYAQEEKKAIDTFNGLVQQAESIAGSDLADRLDKECLSRWNEIVSRMDALELPKGSRMAARYDFLSELARLRRDALVLLVQGLRTGDQTKIDQFKTTQKRAEQLIRSFK